MIAFADRSMVPALKELWKLSFGDPEGYIDLFFEHRFRDKECLVDVEGERVAGMLFLLPITVITPLGEMDARYIYGVATHPDFRGRGISTRLLHRAHREMEKEDVILSILVPATKELFQFYEHRGYAIEFNCRRMALPAGEIPPGEGVPLAESSFAGEAALRNRYFNRCHMFGRWDTRALSYQDIEAGYTGGEVLSFPGGYAYCLPDGDKVLVKELVLPKDVDFYEVAKAVHRRYGAKEYQYRLWEDIHAGELAPYAMAHWIKEKRQKKLEDVEGRASYLGLTLD